MMHPVSVSQLVDFHREERNKIYLQAFIALEIIAVSIAAIVLCQSLFLTMGIGLIIIAGATLYQCNLHHQEIKKMVENVHSYLSDLGGSYLYGLPS